LFKVFVMNTNLCGPEELAASAPPFKVKPTESAAEQSEIERILFMFHLPVVANCCRLVGGRNQYVANPSNSGPNGDA
jgi:hypothetical protein